MTYLNNSNKVQKLVLVKLLIPYEFYEWLEVEAAKADGWDGEPIEEFIVNELLDCKVQNIHPNHEIYIADHPRGCPCTCEKCSELRKKHNIYESE